VINRNRVAMGSNGATVAAIAGAVALVAILLFFSVGQPFGTVNDFALLVMTVSLLPVMLAHYELGGIVPLWPARISLAGSSAAVLAWAVLQAALVVGTVTFDYEHAAIGPFAISSGLQILIGLWIAGASLLAGRWLPSATRWLGIVAGVGTVVMSIGLLLGGVNHPLSYVGGIGYQVILPLWAWRLGRVFRQRAVEARPGAPESGPAAGYPAARRGEGG
jgi:hypothetical protein